MSEVRRKSLGRPTLYALILVGLFLIYQVLSPFLVALTWAVIFAMLFHGMQAALARRIGPNHAALVTTLVVAVVIVAPAVVLISALAREGPQVADSVKQSTQNAPHQIQRIWEAARARSPVPIPVDPSDVIRKGAQRAATFLASRAGAVLGDSLAALGTLAAMLFALFFMLRDGDTMKSELRDRLPFSEQESETLLRDTHDLVVASVGASLVVAIARGVIGGLAFWLAGLSAPVFWGVLMGFASLLPVVGAALVWGPAGIGLLLSGEIGRGGLLLLLGVFGISMADNILRPMLLSGRTSISGFIIFFGLLGGAAAFGLIGLVIGPIILVITGRLLETLHRPDLQDESTRTKDVIVAAKASRILPRPLLVIGVIQIATPSGPELVIPELFVRGRQLRDWWIRISATKRPGLSTSC
jgi:predicted PurR-regulated permease PerM